MIWLASFPRSGNTFLRNALYEVYGEKSNEYIASSSIDFGPKTQPYRFTKTHNLPYELLQFGENFKSIYIVRDGRDALCSIAHHRKDIIAPNSNYLANLEEAIYASGNSFFGGWSKNVNLWLDSCSLVIRFEDLVSNPYENLERISCLVNLPPPHFDKLPTFDDLKFGIPEYGAGKGRLGSEEAIRKKAQKFFRQGKVGGWKDDMPEELQQIFWSLHGETMERLGYSKDGVVTKPHHEFEYNLSKKLGYSLKEKPKIKVLIECEKISSNDNDGVKRYQLELLKAMLPLSEDPKSRWEIDLLFNNSISSLASCANFLDREFEKSKTTILNRVFSNAKHMIIDHTPKFLIRFLARHKIRLFHYIFEWIFQAIDRITNPIPNHARDLALIEKPKSSTEFGKYDLIHLPLMQNFVAFENTPSNYLVTVHDLTHLTHPQFHTNANISNSTKGMEFVSQSKASIIAVSHSTKDDLLDIGFEEHNIHVVHEAADRKLFRYLPRNSEYHKTSMTVRSLYGIDKEKPYILCLSTIEPRKNLVNTITAFKELVESNDDIQLVIAGKTGWKANEVYETTQLNPSNIVFTGFVDDRYLPYLYSEAALFSYVSYYEGFGLPVLEAMSCGTPVVTSNNSSLIEVTGDGGVLVDPNNIEEIRNAFSQIVEYKELRAELSINALRQSANFSWRRAAAETLEIYESLSAN